MSHPGIEGRKGSLEVLHNPALIRIMDSKSKSAGDMYNGSGNGGEEKEKKGGSGRFGVDDPSKGNRSKLWRISGDGIQQRIASMPADGSVLDLSHCNLDSFPKLILKETRFYALQDLNLSTNRLTSVPLQINLLRCLVVLDLTFNKLSDLPGELSEISSLEFVNLSGNPLHKELMQRHLLGTSAVLQYLRDRASAEESKANSRRSFKFGKISTLRPTSSDHHISLPPGFLDGAHAAADEKDISLSHSPISGSPPTHSPLSASSPDTPANNSNSNLSSSPLQSRSLPFHMHRQRVPPPPPLQTSFSKESFSRDGFVPVTPPPPSFSSHAMMFQPVQNLAGSHSSLPSPQISIPPPGSGTPTSARSSLPSQIVGTPARAHASLPLQVSASQIVVRGTAFSAPAQDLLKMTGSSAKEDLVQVTNAFAIDVLSSFVRLTTPEGQVLQKSTSSPAPFRPPLVSTPAQIFQAADPPQPPPPPPRAKAKPSPPAEKPTTPTTPPPTHPGDMGPVVSFLKCGIMFAETHSDATPAAAFVGGGGDDVRRARSGSIDTNGAASAGSSKIKYNLRDAERGFAFNSYCTSEFMALRRLASLTQERYLNSLDSISALGFAGKSGSVLLKSADGLLVLKTISKEEAAFLRRILPRYHDYLCANPHSYLTQFWGLYKVLKSPIEKINFIVMKNAMHTTRKIHERYDLKGSTVGRATIENANARRSRLVLKDLNFNRMLRIGEERRKVFLDQLEKDIGFLESFDIIDYSLIVGVHYLPGPPDKSDVNPFPVVEEIVAMDNAGNPLDEIYFLGIIDMLQPYNLRKKAEYNLKSIRYGTGISVIPPAQYASRFLQFINSVVE